MGAYTQRLLEALERGQRFVTRDVWQIGRPGEEIPYGFIIKHVRVVILLMQGLVKDALLLRAAALTFTTTLALVPLLAILVYVLDTFKLEEKVYDFIAKRIFQGVAQPQPEVLAPHQPTLLDPVQALVDFAKRGSNPQALGFWGVLFMLATVFGLMINIESSFNQIWGLKRTRSYYRTFTDYLVVVLGLPFLAAWVLSTTAFPQFFGFDPGLYTFAVRVAQLVVVWVAFTALYYFVPNTRVYLRYAVLGGLVAGTLWSLTSWAYVAFQFGLREYTLIYQTFAQVPVLLMWIYFSWVILLFGAELTFAYQNEKTFAIERWAAGASHAYREAVGVRAMLEMAWRFQAGLPGLDAAKAAEAWHVPTRLVNDTLRDLEGAGLVRQCVTKPTTYVPARPIEKIRVNDVVTALREAGCEPSALREEAAARENERQAREIGRRDPGRAYPGPPIPTGFFRRRPSRFLRG